MRIVTSDFAGAPFASGTKVSFFTNTGNRLHGTVQRLFLRYARVVTGEGTLWNVPYIGLTITESPKKSAMTLSEIETLGMDLIRVHQSNNGLDAGWKFAFDLAPSRAGICRYKEKQITMSVTYCQKASKAEIVNTILHEVAHAIVGPNHGHDAVWKKAAQQIGCTAERCHRVQHTPPRWLGECGCGKRWKRQRLSQRARNGLCPTCGNKIVWRREGVK